MDISANSSISAMLEQKQSATLQAVQISLFKKTIDMNSEGALALINSATQPKSSANPPNLGQTIDIKA